MADGTKVTADKVYTGSTTDIDAFLKGCDFLQDVWILLEQQPDKVINDQNPVHDMLLVRKCERLDIENIALYTSGRIFNEHFELRWEKQAAQIRFVYAGIAREPFGLEGPSPLLANCGDKVRDYYLFGKRLSSDQAKKIGPPARAGDFAEVRIPRLLRYEIGTSKNLVKLKVCEYVHCDTGESVLYRFKCLWGDDK